MKKKPLCCITNITNCSTDNMSSIYYDGAWTTGGFKVNTHILDLVEITSKAVPTDYMLSLVVPLAHCTTANSIHSELKQGKVSV